jgi:SAM-dependent methyltransferase
MGRPVERNIGLLEKTEGIDSHRFLGRAVQLVYSKQTRLLADLFAEQGQAPQDVSLLDWGSGKGHTAYLLEELGFSVQSCDRLLERDDSSFGQDAPLLSTLQRPTIPLTHDWLLPFEASSYDAVTSFGVLEHVPNDLESLKEIHRVLKPNGVLFISFLPQKWSWTQAVARARGNDYHDRLYTRKGLFDLLGGTGFQTVDIFAGQLLPKNSAPIRPGLEKMDDALCSLTPVAPFATNLIAIARRIP